MKKTLAMGAMLLCIGSAFAQEKDVQTTVVESTDKYEVGTKRFWNNWFISAGAGGQMYFGDYDREVHIGRRIAPALDIAVGKWFTPGMGIRFMYNGLSMKGATRVGDNGDPMTHATDHVYDGRNGVPVNGQKFNFANVHADAMFNLSQLLFGYNEKRVWSFIPYVGLGWMWTWQQPRTHELSGNLGVLNSFRVCSAIDINLEVRGVMVNDRFDGENGGRHEEGLLAVTAGLTYRFGKSGWSRSKTTTIVYNENTLRDLRERLNVMGAENERLKNELVAANNKQPEKEMELGVVTSDYMVAFPIGKSTLSNEARINLGFQADVMKKIGDSAIYVIHGYADKGTGTKAINDRLSKERAQAVFDCLTKEFGIPASQLRMVDEGGVADMFYGDPKMSRAVITRVTSTMPIVSKPIIK
jgi:outer membrane protein OmpA-like peptidoglycan-associated protein